ncbi:MAG: hypothetical protein BWK76_06540 [Desulfobulbaceae bacterium A2]|nr:MAG: hypothetical protein BWK76_06540 [Desulfobulbaceae bacterium A2]
MCDCDCGPKNDCEQPQNLKGTPAQCTPEQIKTCHGDVVGHPCVPKEQQPPLKTVGGCGCSQS